jgi:hypothetical protein
MLSEKLEDQKYHLDKIEEKTEKTLDKTLAVTLRASQITQRTKRKTSQFIGVFQFIDTYTNLFLSCDSDLVKLTSDINRSTFFNLFVKEDNIVGLQNVKTLKFIGCSILGKIIASSTVFGKLEECYINFENNVSGIFVLFRNWGGGGWLKFSIDWNGNRNNFETLVETTSNITDKKDSVVFKVVPIKAEKTTK